MSKRVFRRTISTAIIAILFSVAGTASAADFAPRGSSAAAIGLNFDLSQAWTWLTSAWANVETVFAQSTSDGDTAPSETSTTCTTGDAGCGIDPNG